MKSQPCPICGAPVAPVPESRDRPFCSPRCRYLDLARWLDGSYAVPGEPAEIPDPPRDGERDHDR